MNEATSGRNRRRLKGKLIRPREQLRFSFMLLSLGMLGLIFLVVVGGISINRTLTSLQVIYRLDEEVISSAWASMQTTFLLIIATAFVIGLIGVVLGIHWSHRVFGPMVPFKSHIDQLKAGNYGSRVRLREGDEFGDLRDALNELAEHLEGTSGKRAIATESVHEKP